MAKTVIFTNGCFDVLHRGHIELLRQAKTLGDLLIVGINSDRSVRRLKGRRRPIFNEIDRMRMLDAIKYVDCTVIFDEDTPYQLIDVIRPDVLVKGGDYKKEEIAGSALVESYGGKVVIIPVIKGYRSSKIVKKLEKEL